MIKRILSRTIKEEEWPIWRLPLVFFIGFIIAGVLFYGLYFAPSLSFWRGLDYSPSDKTHAIKLEVGGTLFAVPANYTRNAAGRRAGHHKQIELHALLPSLSGYQEKTQSSFLRVDESSPLLIISIREVSRELPNERRFEALYKPYLDAANGTIENDLQSYHFGADTPYAGKELLRTNAALYICDSAGKPSATCETRFDLGRSAEVSYLFKRHYLKDWRAIDGNIKDLIKSFRSATRTAN